MSHRERGRCSHARYYLTCEEFDSLKAFGGDRCQICDVEGDRTSHGYLVIDHDWRVGEWAVRGLLCSRCNTMLDSNVHVLDRDRVAAYLASPWYLPILAERGIAPDVPPEPPIGSLLRLPNRLVMRRTEDGWVREAGPPSYATNMNRSWSGFHRRFGIHNSQILDGEQVRRIARENGIGPARTGPKARK